MMKQSFPDLKSQQYSCVDETFKVPSSERKPAIRTDKNALLKKLRTTFLGWMQF